MKRKYYILLLPGLFFFLHCRAQKEENMWVFGVAAGLDFNSGNAVSFSTRNSLSPDSSIRPVLNSGSVCDASGQLLFYTDGDWVWNRDNFVMPNGKDLLHPGVSRAGYTTTLDGLQSGTIVRVPGSDHLYYIFSTERNLVGSTLAPHSEGAYLYYSVVDMTLDGGKGDVVAGQKRIPLDSPTLFTQKMAAVAGTNCDVWLMTMTYDIYGGSEFRAYNITSGGINPTPVVSPFGALSTASGFGVLSYIEWTQGKLVFSPDKTRMVHVTGHVALAVPIPVWGGIEIYDFDRATGMLSNSLDLAPGAPVTVGINSVTTVRAPGGAAFSPDGSKLYAVSNQDSVYQWDLSLPTPADIVASRKGVAKITDVAGSDLKTGPDGKIYFGYNIGTAGFTSQSLHRIESPNLAGTACNVVFNAVPLQPDTRFVLGFPNAVGLAAPGDTAYTLAQDTLVCSRVQGAPLMELKAPAYPGGIEWEDGATDTTHVIYNAGTYWVRNNSFCYPRVDTFVVRGGYIPPVSIIVDEYTIAAGSIYDSYQWYRDGVLIPGATDSAYTVDTNGVYSLKVSLASGCTDSTSYPITNVSVREAVRAQAIRIYPSPAHDYIMIRSGTPLHNAGIRLINLTGQVVAGQSGLNGAAFRYDVAAYPPGMYIVEIQENGQKIRTGFLKR